MRFCIAPLSHGAEVRDSLAAMRSLSVAVAVLVVMIAACKDRSAKAPPPAPTVPVAPTQQPTGAIAATDIRSPAARCLYACLTLLDTPLADAPGAYAKACKKPWPYATDDCDALRYARTCIDAAYGRVFERRAWIDRFTHTAWYQPNPAFAPSLLSPAAAANALALDAADATCRKAIPAVTAEDRALAMTWFAKLMGPKPPTIEGVFTDPKNLHADLGDLVFDGGAQIAYLAVPAKGRRTISISGMHHPDGRVDPDRALELTFVGAELIGVGW